MTLCHINKTRQKCQLTQWTLNITQTAVNHPHTILIDCQPSSNTLCNITWKTTHTNRQTSDVPTHTRQSTCVCGYMWNWTKHKTTIPISRSECRTLPTVYSVNAVYSWLIRDSVTEFFRIFITSVTYGKCLFRFRILSSFPDNRYGSCISCYSTTHSIHIQGKHSSKLPGIFPASHQESLSYNSDPRH